jgi:hypothetical protein
MRASSSLTQTYGDGRLLVFKYKSWDVEDVAFRRRLGRNLLVFHGSPAPFRRAVEDGAFFRDGLFEADEVAAEVPYPRTLERTLRRLRGEGVRTILFLQDDAFSLRAGAGFDDLHAFASAHDFPMLSLELTSREVDVAQRRVVFEGSKLRVHEASSEDFRKAGIWAMDDGPFLANLDFLLQEVYDETYFSMPDVWSAEAYLKEKVEKQPIPRWAGNVRFWWRVNLVGPNGRDPAALDFLLKRFPERRAEVMVDWERLSAPEAGAPVR